VQLAIVVYPGFTNLDWAGAYEVLSRLPNFETILVSEKPGQVVNDMGHITVSATGLDAVTEPDIVLIGGGPGQQQQMDDGLLHQWLRAADQTCAWMTSVCTGSLILAASGVLDGRRATSHWLTLDQLSSFGVRPTSERVVFDDHYVTAAGVSASIDMALALAGRITSDEAAQALQLLLEYDPHPPYDAGSPASAPASVVDRLTTLGRPSMKDRG
jgi:transcriptional regulator GlxA family with amidase domain